MLVHEGFRNMGFYGIVCVFNYVPRVSVWSMQVVSHNKTRTGLESSDVAVFIVIKCRTAFIVAHFISFNLAGCIRY